MTGPERPGGRLARPAQPPSVALGAVASRDLARELLQRVREEGFRADAEHNLADVLAALSIEIEVRADVFANRFSRRRVAEVFGMAWPFVASGDLSLDGATVVELGCGALNPLAALLVHVLAGARLAVGVDLDPPLDPATAARGLARVATYALAEPSLLNPHLAGARADVLRRFAGFDLVKLWLGDPAGIDARRLVLREAPAERTGLPDAAVDLAYSVSFLEHVANPDAVAHELARITRPGGVGVHAIDGRDHRCYTAPGHDPLAFLAEPAGPALVHGCNRLRPTQFAAVFERAGFEVLAFEEHDRLDVPDARRAAFAPPFRELPREALEVIGGWLRVRRR